MSDIHYKIQRYTASVSIPEYIDRFVDVETFLGACKACHNYNQKWSCPSYDFDVLEYWNQYKTFRLLASQIIFPEDILSKTYTQEQLNEILDNILPKEKQKLSDELLTEESKHPGSISLSAGSCIRCKSCTKAEGKPCRFPDKMRYSIESLGGNVGLTIEKLMGLHLEWMKNNKLPHHFVLVCGLLLP